GRGGQARSERDPSLLLSADRGHQPARVPGRGPPHGHPRAAPRRAPPLSGDRRGAPGPSVHGPAVAGADRADRRDCARGHAQTATINYNQGIDRSHERLLTQARPSVIAPTPSRPDLTEKPPPPSPARPPSPPPTPPAAPPPSPSEREPILAGERQGVLAVLLGVATVGVWALIVRRRRKRFSARA